jgi:hypothetical protein
MDEGFIKSLSKKTGKGEQDARDLINAVNAIRTKEKICAGELMDLNKKMEKFSGVI